MTNPQFVIRTMEDDDARAVADLTTQLGYPASEGDIKRRYVPIKSRTDGRILVAEKDGTVVGWIHIQGIFMLESDPRAEIFGLVVSDTQRGSGAGRALVEAAEKWAEDAGFQVVGLRSRIQRSEAHGFYQHLGYSIVKTQHAFRKSLA